MRAFAFLPLALCAQVTLGEVYRTNRAFNVPGTGSRNGVSTPNNQLLFTPARDGNQDCIRTFALPDTNQFTQTCGLRIYPNGLAVSPDGLSLYVSGTTGGFVWGVQHLHINYNNRSVTLLDFEDAGGTFPNMAISPDGRHLYGVGYGELSDRDSLWVYSRATSGSDVGRLTFVRKFDFVGYGNHPTYIGISADGLSLFTANWRTNFVLALRRNPASGDVSFITRVERVGNSLSSLVVLPGAGGSSHVYVSDLGVNIYHFVLNGDNFALRDTYNIGVSSTRSFQQGPRLWGDASNVLLGMHNSLISFRRDPSDGRLTGTNYITDDTTPFIQWVHAAGGAVYTSTRVYALAPNDNNHNNNHTKLALLNKDPQTAAVCEVNYVDNLSGTRGSCNINLDGARDYTYACFVQGTSLRLELDRVRTWATQGEVLNTIGWINHATRGYGRFNLNCQSRALGAGFECEDDFSAVSSLGRVEHVELLVAPDFLSVCTQGTCCNIRGTQGECNGRRITRSAACESGFQLNIGGLSACMVRTSSSSRFVQHVSRWGTADTGRFDWHFKVSCS